MRRGTVVFLVLFSLLVLNCSKEDGKGGPITTFQGVVLMADTSEPFTNGQIQLIGSEALSFTYRESFAIESDGSFNIRVAPKNITLFQISIVSDDFQEVSQSCEGTSISQYCTLMEAGKDHRNITVMAYPSN